MALPIDDYQLGISLRAEDKRKPSSIQSTMNIKPPFTLKTKYNAKKIAFSDLNKYDNFHPK